MLLNICTSGPYHCWLNKFEGGKYLFKKDGTFLVLAGHFSEDSLKNGHEHVIFFEKVKLLHRRTFNQSFYFFPLFPLPSDASCFYDFLIFMLWVQSGNFNCTATVKNILVQSMVKENITFPVLLSNKNFPKWGHVFVNTDSGDYFFLSLQKDFNLICRVSSPTLSIW
ncbi:hypothetical protein UlMin_038664 [Ulmus minor]